MSICGFGTTVILTNVAKFAAQRDPQKSRELHATITSRLAQPKIRGTRELSRAPQRFVLVKSRISHRPPARTADSAPRRSPVSERLAGNTAQTLTVSSRPSSAHRTGSIRGIRGPYATAK